MQNGEVKPVKAAAADCVQIVNETEAAEQPACTTSSDQQVEAESTPLVAQSEKETRAEETSSPTEPTQLEETSDGPPVTVEVWGT